MPFGLTSTGYVGKTQSQCRAEINSLIQTRRGQSLDLSDASLEGCFAGIVSERESLLWDLGQTIVASQDPDAASDASQDALCALTGTFRTPARSSSAIETFTGTPATVLPINTQVKTTSTSALFQTTAAATIVAVPAWVTATLYAVGTRVTNAGFVYQCITAGTSVTGPTGTLASNPDTSGTLVWKYLGLGTGAVDQTVTSLVQDVIIAVSGDLNVQATSVSGWQSCINVLDAIVGAPLQTSASLRITRESELAGEGNATAVAIRAKLLTVANVTACTVFVNNTDTIDVNGQAPHSIQVLIQGGSNTDIANKLQACVGAGPQTVGTTTVNVVDSQGIFHPWSFTRPAPVLIYVDVTLTYNSATPAAGGYPSNGDAAVAASLTTYGNARGAGADVVASALASGIFPIYLNTALVLGVQGVLDVSQVLVSLTPSPTLPTTLVITPFQIAVFDTSRVTVHSSIGSV